MLTAAAFYFVLVLTAADPAVTAPAATAPAATAPAVIVRGPFPTLSACNAARTGGDREEPGSQPGYFVGDENTSACFALEAK
jgi:hypothetical protein